jgi:transcriptional regulator with XRE-family HTH domain
MIKGIGQRIRIVRTEIVKTSQMEFSEVVCMTQSNLSMLENEKTYPNCFMLFALSQIYKININWLLTGNGDRLLEELIKEENKK